MTRDTDTSDSERRPASAEDEDDAGESRSITRDLSRRPLLKALGVGAALTVGSGTVVGDSVDSQSMHIDPIYGHPTPDPTTLSDGTVDHTVDLHIIEPTPYSPGPPMDTEHGPMFHFAPPGLAIEPGHTVQFNFTTPDHTVTAYHPGHGFQQRVPNDVPPFSSPVVNAGGAWLYTFNKPGLYDIYCAPHHILGMAMRIVVGEPGGEEGFKIPDYENTFEVPTGSNLLPPFSKAMLEAELEHFSEPHQNKNPEWVWLTPQVVLDADALDPGNIYDKGSVGFDAVLAEIDRIQEDHTH